MAAANNFPIKLTPIQASTYTSMSKPSSVDISLEEDVHLHPWSSVTSVGIAYTNGSKRFAPMENAHVSIDNLDGSLRTGFFGIFDGRNGFKCSQMLTRYIPEAYVRSRKVHDSEDLRWSTAFKEVDGKICKSIDLVDSGASAACMVIQNIKDRRVISCANVGNVGIMAIQDGKPIKLTETHDINHGRDAYHVRMSGGSFAGGKVNGYLEITRCFGESILKEKILTAEPYCRTLDIAPATSHIILATKGLWKMLSDSEIADIVTKADKDVKLAAKNLISASYGCGDNLTIMVIDVRNKF